MNRKKRKRTSEPKKPASVRSYTIVGISVVSILVFAAALYLTIESAGNSMKVLAAAGTIAMIVALCCVFYGIRELRNKNFDRLSRVLGVIAPVVALLLWLGVYAIGFIRG